MTQGSAENILSVSDLVVSFSEERGDGLRAVDGVSFDLKKGEVLGLVGESGSGKSVTGLAIMGLIDRPGRVSQGSVKFQGQELVGRPERELRRLRGRDLAMIFQDPMSTLNPVLRIDTQMMEAIHAHERVSSRAARDRARQALQRVGISTPEERLNAYPHQFSGGMRQRVAIATALLNRPALLIADEPTTALDVSIQSQILSQVQDLCAEMGTSIIWITHDLSVVCGLADRIAVMYAGRVVEQGNLGDVVRRPLHPYTNGLIASVPSRNVRGQRLQQIPGIAPSLSRKPAGCAFASRCACVGEKCRHIAPPPTMAPDGRVVRCHYYNRMQA